MSKRTIRCFSRTLVLSVAVLVIGSGAALAQHITGVNIQKNCPFFVDQGAAYTCTFSLQNNDVDHGVINMHVFESHPPVACGFNQMTPCVGEVEVTCTGGPTVNSLAAKNTAGDTCTGTLPEITAPITCSTDDFQDIDRIRSTGNDAGQPALSATGSTDNGPVVRGLLCPPDLNLCDTESCSVGVGCIHTPNAPCDDSNACTTDTCDPAIGCVFTPNPPCNDDNACTTDTCDPAIGCVFTPNPPCNDDNACTTDTCDPAIGCVFTPNPPCNDSNACTTDTCDPAIGCVFTPNPPCDDSDPCTVDTCEPATGCVFTPDPTLPGCSNEEVCRTPGFWGTHGGIEKGGPNITQLVLNETGPLSICGVTISTTDLTNLSAIEAICVSPKGDSALQLARQLTAAALNCGVTKSTSCGGGGQVGTICSGVSIETTFNDCNATCADPTSTKEEITACIDAIDCFNNGGEGLEGGVCVGNTGCHDRNGAGCIDLSHPGPASSPKKCNDARKDDCTVLCAVACSDTVACP